MTDLPSPPALWRPPRPFPIPLLTKRLRLAWWTPEDAPGLWEAIETSRTTLAPWMPWALTSHRDPEETLERIEAWTRQRQAPEPDEFFLGIFDRASGEVLGGTGFHRVIAELGQAECGYWIRASHRDQGLCTEAVRALITSAFRDWGLRRIVIECAGSNVASRRVAEKASLPLEAVHKQSRWVEHHGWCDSLGYGVLAEEWDQVRERRKDGVPSRR